jgi:SET domain-containing protein
MARRRRIIRRGRCVFAAAPLQRGMLIERAPCIRIPRSVYDAQGLQRTPLEHYVFVERATNDLLLALGIGSLFNHSDTPNVDYRVGGRPDGDGGGGGGGGGEVDPQGLVTFRTCKAVEAGDELCIYYGDGLWFREGHAVE